MPSMAISTANAIDIAIAVTTSRKIKIVVSHIKIVVLWQSHHKTVGIPLVCSLVIGYNRSTTTLKTAESASLYRLQPFCCLL